MVIGSNDAQAMAMFGRHATSVGWKLYLLLPFGEGGTQTLARYLPMDRTSAWRVSVHWAML